LISKWFKDLFHKLELPEENKINQSIPKERGKYASSVDKLGIKSIEFSFQRSNEAK